jgi:hypothetical protein
MVVGKIGMVYDATIPETEASSGTSYVSLAPGTAS